MIVKAFFLRKKDSQTKKTSKEYSIFFEKKENQKRDHKKLSFFCREKETKVKDMTSLRSSKKTIIFLVLFYVFLV